MIAVVVMLAAAIFQRKTGPTYPVSGSAEVAGQDIHYEFLTSGNTPEAARVALTGVPSDVEGTLYWKRYPTDEPYQQAPLVHEEGDLVGWIPPEPAAGKVEYYVVLSTPETVRLPLGDESTVIMRFKDPVPIYLLLPHVLFMFVGMLIGVRAGLEALVGGSNVRRLTWLTVGGLTIGGMVLGPLVQLYAFGALWTGFPFGYDLTDNKTLLMWLAWIGAMAALGRQPRPEPSRLGRWAVVGATVVTLAVYVIPHSLRGSELDYGEAKPAGIGNRESGIVQDASSQRFSIPDSRFPNVG